MTSNSMCRGGGYWELGIDPIPSNNRASITDIDTFFLKCLITEYFWKYTFFCC